MDYPAAGPAIQPGRDAFHHAQQLLVEQNLEGHQGVQQPLCREEPRRSSRRSTAISGEEPRRSSRRSTAIKYTRI